jgi:hypothetical protein
MARTAIPVVALTKNSSTAPGNGVAADSTNDHVINAVGTGNLILEITAGGTAGDGGTVTIVAGDLVPAFQSLGDLSVTVADGARVLIGPLETARFLQSDGTILVDAASLVGTFRCFRVPEV